MSLYLVVTQADVARRVPRKDDVCRIRPGVYFIRVADDDDDTAEALAERLGLSEEVNGTVAKIEELAGWEDDSVTNVVNQWIYPGDPLE